LELGKRVTARHFGKEPRAIWLPECAYRPGYKATASNGEEYERPGIERWLEERDLNLFFSESSAVEGSQVLGRAQRSTREVMKPVSKSTSSMDIYGQVERTIEEMGYEHAGWVTDKMLVPYEGAGQAGAGSGTFEAYYVGKSDVAVVGRNRVVGEQVWSAMFGYPGEGEYREFHKKEAVHGFQYWRVTDSQTDLAYKQTYDPFRAGQKVQDHADHFVWLIENQLRDFSKANAGGKQGFLASAYDTELFGHWWFEGVSWLKEVLTRLAANENVELTTASEWLERHPPEKAIDLPESSWGHAGTHVTWINPDTNWMWEALHGCEQRMEGLVGRYAQGAPEAVEEALNQAARELVLLEASDWEFLYTTGQARQYAGERFAEHVNRFNDLAAAIESEQTDHAVHLARSYRERDNLFPDIDYRLFAQRQPV
jgi:1,4-alpha-glucan branching enzyme